MSSKNFIRNPRNLRRTALAVALGLCMTSGAVLAQSTVGSVFGSAPASAGDTIVVTGSTGLSRTVKLGADGRYSVGDLPTGEYSVALFKNGERVTTHDHVAVSAGAGIEVDFVSGSESAQSMEAMQVVANSLPAIDVTNVNSSMTLSAEDLVKLPVVRNAESIALLAPGTVAGSGYFGNAVSFSGAGVTENTYYVNGYNTSEPYRNTGGFQLPYGSIDQQQTLTGGYSAKYGRSDGGVLNQIGKRGTNEWHFGGQIVWSPRTLASDPHNHYFPDVEVPEGYTLDQPDLVGTLERYRNDNKSWTTGYSAYVGGPLVKDRLFLFFSAETNKTRNTSVAAVGTDTVDYYTNNSHNFYGKLDWNINDNNILELTKLRHESASGSGATYAFDNDNFTSGEFLTNNDVTKNNADITVLKYTSYLTDNATLSVLYGRGNYKDPYVYANQSKNPAISGALNEDPAITGGGYITNDQTNFYNYSSTAGNKSHGLRVDFSYQLGQQLLSAGIDNMTIAAKNQGQAMSGPGYAWIYSHTGSPESDINNFLGVGAPHNAYYVAKYIYSVQTSMSLDQKAYYLQDDWSITNDFLLSLGLRNDRFTNYNDLGIAFVDEKNQWEPRIGFSWDVNGDSTFKVYGNAGRYYLALPDNVAERAANRSTYTREYFTYTGIDANGIPTGLTPVEGVGGTAPPGPVSADNELGQPKDARQVTASNLKAQYQDEFILGFDKTLGDKWVYGAKLTYRSLKTAIDDECDPGKIYDKIATMGLNPDDYYDSIVNPYCRLINPGLTNDLQVKGNDGNYITVTMTQDDWGYKKKAQRKYEGLDLYLEHPFDGKWQGRLDYTYARNRGNTEGQVRSDFGQADVSKTEDWDAWQLMEYAYGDLINGRRHSLRARGAYQITPQWLVSGTLLVQSGTPEECLGFYGTDDSDPIGYGPNQHWCFGHPAPPGSTGWTPWTETLNLGLRYTPAFADGRLSFGLNIFNALDQQREVQVDPVSEADHYTVSNTYHDAIFFQTPRSVQLSLSYDF